MGLFSKIFGSKKKSTSEQTSESAGTSSSSPDLLPTYQGPVADIGTRAGELLKQDPAALVAGLTDSQKAAITGVNAMADDPTLHNRNVWAINDINSGTTAQNRAALAAGPDMGAFEANRVGSGYQPLNVSAPALNTNYTGAIDRVGTSDTTASDIQSRMTPYQQSVIDPALKEYDLNSAIQSAQSRARRAGQRAFGDMGERSALMEQYLQGLGREKVQSGLLQSGYESASALTQADKARALQAGTVNVGAATSEQGLNAQTGVAGAQMGLQGQIANQQAGLTANAQSQAAQSTNLQALLQMLGLKQEGLAQAGAQGNQAAALTSNIGAQDVQSRLSILQGQAGAGATEYDVNQRQLQAPYTQLNNVASIVNSAPMGQTNTSSSSSSGSGTNTQVSTPSLFDVGSGVAKMVMGFRHGGHVPGYAGGGAASAWNRHYNNQHRRPYAAGGAVDDDLGMLSLLPAEVRANMERGPPIPALQDTSRMSLDDPSYYGYDAADQGYNARRGLTLMRDDEFVRTRNQPQPLDDDAALATGAFDVTGYGGSRRESPPALSAASNSELMSKTLAAMASTPRRGFMDRVREFMDKDSTVEGLAMFSPAWAALAERRDSQRQQAQKMAFEAALEDKKFGQQSALERFKAGNALAVANISHPKPMGMWDGTGEGAQDSNIALQYKRLYESGQPIPPDLEAAYQIARSRLVMPRQFTQADGTTVQMPGVDMSGFPVPRGGGAALGPGDRAPAGGGGATGPGLTGSEVMKPLTGPEIMMNGLLDEGRPLVPQMRELAKNPATLDILTMNFDVPGTDGARLRNTFDILAKNRLRFESQGQISKQEIEGQAKALLPSTSDSQVIRRQKLQSMLNWWESALQNQNPRRRLDGGALKPRKVYDKAKGDFVDGP